MDKKLLLIGLVGIAGLYFLTKKKELKKELKKDELPEIPDKTGKKPSYNDIKTLVYATECKIPKHIVLAIIEKESNFNPEAIPYSGSNHYGLFQMYPLSVKDTGYSWSDYKSDWRTQVLAGMKFLDICYKQTGSINEAIKVFRVGYGNYTQTDEDKIYGFNSKSEMIKVMNEYLDEVLKRAKKYE